MEETLGWLRWLKPEHAKLVWARAERTPWKQICWRFGISRATAHWHWRYALTLIAYRLNGRALSAAATVEIGGYLFEIIATPIADSLGLAWTCEAAPPA
jgi:hypothetical protein